MKAKYFVCICKNKDKISPQTDSKIAYYHRQWIFFKRYFEKNWCPYHSYHKRRWCKVQCSQRDLFYIRWTLKLTPIVIHEICGDGQVINGSTEGVVTYIQPQVHPDMSLDLRHIHTARHVVTAGPQVTPHFVGVSNTSQGTDRNQWAI